MLLYYKSQPTFVMAASLDRVLQPDGSYKWQLVELRAEALYEKDQAPAAETQPRKSSRKAKDFESTELSETNF